jgi:hypothetical protein
MNNEERNYYAVLIRKRYHERWLDYGLIRNLEFYGNFLNEESIYREIT